jgi:3-oxoacyl-[acyl-carrier-protein] synthase-1
VGEVQASNESLAVRLGITETISRTALLGVAAVREALSQAAIHDLTPVAFISGTTVGGMDHTERYWREKESCASSVVELHTAGSSTEQIARQVGTFTMTGTISTACSSALNAVIAACNLIRSGQYRQVVAGGAESLSLFHFNGFRALQILSDEVCRPFSSNRKGLNLGEAAATIIYSYQSSDISNPPCWTLVKGSIHNDANHISAPSRTGEGAYRCLTDVLEGVSPADIRLLGVHGTATLYNDDMERTAIRRAGLQDVPMSVLKPFFGHTMGAAGVLETIIAMNMVKNEKKVNVIKMLSGFGGVNAAIRLQCE